ncbi:MAG TPA: DUF4326 domain-containing protein [Pseudonocardiaceae bacterium]
MSRDPAISRQQRTSQGDVKDEDKTSIAPTSIYRGRHLYKGVLVNPFTVANYGRACAVELYIEHLRNSPDLVDRIREELAGRDLACFCALDDVCHADVLLRVAVGGAP